jgi:NADPH:quinone reductase-like Zn-dependent oxidoreductase
MTMKAVCIHTFGDPGVLQLEDIAVPVPGPSEVLVEVRAAGVNPVDRMTRAGYLQQMLPYKLPLVLGLDFAGVVHSDAAGVVGVAAGDEVFGNAPFDRCGAYAQLIGVPATVVVPQVRHDVTSCCTPPRCHRPRRRRNGARGQQGPVSPTARDIVRCFDGRNSQV